MDKKRLFELAGIVNEASREQMLKNIELVIGESDFSAEELVLNVLKYMTDEQIRRYYDAEINTGGYFD